MSESLHQESLWGDTFNIDDSAKTKKILKKINEPKEVKEINNKAITNKKITLEEKLSIIKDNVYRILGNHKEDTLVIKTKEDFVHYIDKAIENGLIVIDTETNNSLDPITCKLMGPCLYTPGMKQAYVPINHVDYKTNERLSWQLTEEDCKEQFNRLLNGVKVIFHNGKFDYEVIKCTCGVELPIYWDTLIGARLLNENEKAGLKDQFVLHIDQEQEKYSIEKLFEKEEYAIFEPELFALYAATDAYMTYKLYLYQLDSFELKDNERVYRLFKDVEMPCVKVVAEMELSGIEVDLEYCSRLGNKYHIMLDKMSEDISNELKKYDSQISEWRKTPEANYHPPKKTGEGEGKSKGEQLTDPINLASPTQLAIFFYDILKIEPVDKLKPRGTGKDELTKIYERTKIELCNMLLEYKKMTKLVESFLDTLPEQVNSKTGRIHCNFNQIGADTGRFSCSNPNLQQIPSKNKEIRLMFRACCKEREIKLKDNYYEVPYTDEVETINGWKMVKDIVIGDILISNEDKNDEVIGIDKIDNNFILYVR